MRPRLPLFSALAPLLLASFVRADAPRNEPPAFFRKIFAAAPPTILHLESASLGTRAALFFDEGSMFAASISSEGAPAPKSYVQTWDGKVWSAPQPFARVSAALTVGGEIWALTDGGYLTSGDGTSWSSLNSRPDWMRPFGCVVDGRPHVFYLKNAALKETAYDGKVWSEPRTVPGDWSSESDFPFHSGLQAAPIDGRIRIFSERRDGRGDQIIAAPADGSDDALPETVVSGDMFRVMAAPDAIHLFYRDLSPAPAAKPASLSDAFSMMSEMQARAMRTYHRVYQGGRWTEPEEILTGQATALSAVQTDDTLRLFASAMTAVLESVRRDGRWGDATMVAGSAAPSSGGKGAQFAQLAKLYVLIAVPFMCFIAALVWGVSALIESTNAVELELPGRRARCASLFRRATALFVDGLILGAAQTAVFAAIGLGGLGPRQQFFMNGHFFAAWFAIMGALLGAHFLYFTVCEARWGRTPGKRLLSIRVLKEDGAPCTALAASLRNLLRIIDFIPWYLAGTLALALGKKHQRVGDMAAGTIVVVDAPR